MLAVDAKRREGRRELKADILGGLGIPSRLRGLGVRVQGIFVSRLTSRPAGLQLCPFVDWPLSLTAPTGQVTVWQIRGIDPLSLGSTQVARHIGCPR